MSKDWSEEKEPGNKEIGLFILGCACLFISALCFNIALATPEYSSRLISIPSGCFAMFAGLTALSVAHKGGP